jgi:hypothetical protein
MLRASQIAHDLIEKLLRHGNGVTILVERPMADCHNLAVAHYFSAQGAKASDFDAEQIAGDMKGVDLTAAVGQKFAGPDDAGQDFVVATGLLTFAIDFTILFESQDSSLVGPGFGLESEIGP